MYTYIYDAAAIYMSMIELNYTRSQNEIKKESGAPKIERFLL